MPRLADLISKGQLPNYRAKGPAEFDGQTVYIVMATLKTTESLNNNSNTVMQGFECDIRDSNGITHKLMSQSAALTQQVKDQFLPFSQEIGEELEVTIVGEASQKDPKRKVYHFE